MSVTELQQEKFNLRSVLDKVVVQKNTEDRLGILDRTIEPEQVQTMVVQAAQGQIGRLQELYLKMEATDARYSGLVNSLKSSVAAFPLRVFPGDESSQAQEIAAATQFMFERMRVKETIRRLAMFYVRGVTLHELEWQLRPYNGTQYAMVTNVATIPGSRLIMDTQRDSQTYGMIRITSQANPQGDPLIKYPAGKFVMQRADGSEPGFYDMGGAARRCLSWYLCKVYSQRFWAEFNEVYGEPIRLAFHDSATDEEKRVLQSFLETMGRSMYGMFPAGTSIQLLESNRQGTIKTYNDLIQLANDEMTVAFFGGVQTVDGGENGSFAKANVHNMVRHDIVVSVAEEVNEALAEIVRYFVLFNWGDSIPEELYPKVRIVANRPTDIAEMANVFNAARNYIEIPKQHVYDVLAIPAPRPGEEVLEKGMVFGDPLGEGGEKKEEDKDGSSETEKDADKA
jgi:phage gp29-like protein